MLRRRQTHNAIATCPEGRRYEPYMCQHTNGNAAQQEAAEPATASTRMYPRLYHHAWDRSQ